MPKRTLPPFPDENILAKKPPPLPLLLPFLDEGAPPAGALLGESGASGPAIGPDVVVGRDINHGEPLLVALHGYCVLIASSLVPLTQFVLAQVKDLSLTHVCQDAQDRH